MTLRLLAALALALSPAGPAAAASGKLVFASGEVTAGSGAKTRPVATGAAVAAGETVRTGPKSLAILMLDDGSTLKLRDSSAVTLGGRRRAKGLTEVFLTLGGVFSRVVPGQGREFRLRTPQAVAAVRGTDFFTAFGPKKGKVRNLWLCVGEGKVEVKSLANKKKVVVKAGQGILIKAGKDITDPQAYEWTKGLNWNMNPEMGAVEDDTKFAPNAAPKTP